MAKDVEIVIPYKPHARQLEAHLCKAPYILYGGAMSGGKMLCVETEIPTPSGFVPLKDIHVGDVVFGSNGKPCIVTNETPEKTSVNCFEFIFSSGAKVYADGDHLWKCWGTKNRKRDKAQVKSTQMLYSEYQRGKKSAIEVTGPVEYITKSTVDPYAAGHNVLRNPDMGLLLMSFTERQKLLGGVFDKIGTLQKDTGVIETHRQDVHDFVVALVSSLGYRLNTICRGHFWDIRFKGPIYSKREGFQNLEAGGIVRIKNIVKCDKQLPMKCLEVDSPDHTYLVTKYHVPTHNSMFLVHDMLQYALDFKGNKVGIFRWEGDVFMKTTYITMRDHILGIPGLVKRHNKNAKEITLFNGSEIRYGGLKPSSAASGDILATIKSSEFGGIYIDEATDVPEEVMKILPTRMSRTWAINTANGLRQRVPPRLVLTCNPELGYIKKTFIDSPKEGYAFIPAKFTDNPYNDETQIETIKETLGDRSEQYFEGSWDAVADWDSVFKSEYLIAATKYSYAPVATDDMVFGVDVAGKGDDLTVITLRHGRRAVIIAKGNIKDTMATANMVYSLYEKYTPSLIYCDGIGNGEGVCDRLLEFELPVIPVIGSESPDKPTFLNKRAENYWNLRMLLERGEVDLPNDPDLINEMGVIKYGMDNTDRAIKIESKTLLKKRLGKSPDLADSVVYAFIGTADPPVLSGILEG